MFKQTKDRLFLSENAARNDLDCQKSSPQETIFYETCKQFAVRMETFLEQLNNLISVNEEAKQKISNIEPAVQSNAARFMLSDEEFEDLLRKTLPGYIKNCKATTSISEYTKVYTGKDLEKANKTLIDTLYTSCPARIDQNRIVGFITYSSGFESMLFTLDGIIFQDKKKQTVFLDYTEIDRCSYSEKGLFKECVLSFYGNFTNNYHGVPTMSNGYFGADTISSSHLNTLISFVKAVKGKDYKKHVSLLIYSRMNPLSDMMIYCKEINVKDENTIIIRLHPFFRHQAEKGTSDIQNTLSVIAEALQERTDRSWKWELQDSDCTITFNCSNQETDSDATNNQLEFCM